MATSKGGNKLAGALNRITNNLRRGKFVKSGFLRKATYPDGTSVAMIAAIQNYGAPGVGIPPRPFFSNMIADKSPGWGVAVALNLKAANYDADVALNRVGEGIDKQLRQSIKDTNTPPLAPSTLAKRGYTGKAFNKNDPKTFGAKPLVDTGIMLGSVNHEVVK